MPYGYSERIPKPIFEIDVFHICMGKIKIRVRKIIRPIENFLHMEAAGGILLMISTFVAILWVNSPYKDSYDIFWQQKFMIGFGDFVINKPIWLWVNDGLMSIFFFFVGLEIKREVLAGELSSFKDAAMPIAAAFGGMIVPAVLYIALVFNTEHGKEGWGIPMATDIAFSIGILTLLGKRVPLSLKVFLTALAIVDDIGAVLVIALFYTGELHTSYILWSVPFFGIMILLNIFNVRHIPLYLIPGMIIWYMFLKSGIHPTVCGVLAAFTIPARRKINFKEFLRRANDGMKKLQKGPVEESSVVLDKFQMDAIYTVEEASDKVQSPLQRLENTLHAWVVNFIMPVFALANAAIVLELKVLETLLTPVALAIAASLVIGKSTGIFLFSWLSYKLKIAQLRPGITWKRIYGVGLLGGIGFTMSLFISSLAFADKELIMQAKMGILFGSLISGFAGYFFLKKIITSNG